ncbi:hypothetical protein [Sphingomonas sp. PAMC 26621]|uniref:hypothetical protein n=1 Tax=Sphingomonas sp. PAMC 26621 TaxID=1112213 RepID=UPI0002F3C192|nr:hypothetical protein [Sphingomonas sp. PAMC 26621]
MTDGDSNKGNANLPGNVVALRRRRHVINELDLVRLLAGHWKLDTLCDLLEACADALPTRPSLAQSIMLCEKLSRLIDLYEHGGTMLLHEMFEPDLHRPLTNALLDHIVASHAVDSANAQDLIAALDPASGEASRFSAEILGYMLRCFFDGCRRAMNFTELAILTLGEKRLTPDAKTLLTKVLQDNAKLRVQRADSPGEI